MNENAEQLHLAILKALGEEGGALGSRILVQRLRRLGFEAPDRTIRYHLRQLDRQGFTRLVSRRQGRRLTDRGREELTRSRVLERLGFVSARMDDLVYRMTFDGREDVRPKTVIANFGEVSARDLNRAIQTMAPVFHMRWSMGSRILLVREGENVAGWSAPPGRALIGTLCSAVVSGMLAKRGIPVATRFGGLLELEEGMPRRFTALIEYTGSTCDPVELLIEARRTRVLEGARTGSGIIAASFREVPAAALPDVEAAREDLRRSGMDAILLIGTPNRPVLDIPVADGRVGMVVLAGMNPYAALCESGIPVRLHPMAALIPYGQFRAFNEILATVREPAPLID